MTKEEQDKDGFLRGEKTIREMTPAREAEIRKNLCGKPGGVSHIYLVMRGNEYLAKNGGWTPRRQSALVFDNENQARDARVDIYCDTVVAITH
jgi:hypothetical protein